MEIMPGLRRPPRPRPGQLDCYGAATNREYKMSQLPFALALTLAIADVGAIVAADGGVLLQRPGWQDYHPASVGTELYAGDLLQPEPGAKVIVLRGNLRTWQVPDGVESVFAAESSPEPEVCPDDAGNNAPCPRDPIFAQLDEGDAWRVLGAMEQLKDLELPQESRDIALAYLYMGYALRQDALELLESLSDRGSQTAAVYRLLGELYGQQGQYSQAEFPYQRAVDLAANLGDIEGQTAAQLGLQKIYYALSNPENAAYWSNQARQGYRTLWTGKTS